MKKFFSFFAVAVVCAANLFAASRDKASEYFVRTQYKNERKHKHKRAYNSAYKREHKHEVQKREQKKVLFIVPFLIMGGIDKAFIDMVRFLPLKGKDYDVCILQRGGIFEQFLPKKVKIVTPEQAIAKKYDVVVSYAQWMSSSLFLDQIKAKKRVQWIHTDLLHCGALYEVFENSENIKKVNCFVGVSQKVSDSIRSAYPEAARKVKTIYNFLDDQAIRKKALGVDVRGEIVRNGSEPIVITVSRLSIEKGFERSIAIHKRLEAEGIHFKWYVLGDGEAQYEAALRAEAKNAGLEERFIFLGRKTNPYSYMRAADIFVLASFFEGCSVVISEAQIVGCPVLATEAGGVREQIVSEKTGIIVDNNEEAIYLGLKRLLLDTSLRSNLKKNLKHFFYDNQSSCRKVLCTLLGKEGKKLFQKTQKKNKKK